METHPVARWLGLALVTDEAASRPASVHCFFFLSLIHLIRR